MCKRDRAGINQSLLAAPDRGSLVYYQKQSKSIIPIRRFIIALHGHGDAKLKSVHLMNCDAAVADGIDEVAHEYAATNVSPAPPVVGIRVEEAGVVDAAVVLNAILGADREEFQSAVVIVAVVALVIIITAIG